jgi:hypothetical protein
VALLAKTLSDEPSDLSVVLDDEDSHVAVPETFLMCLSCPRHGLRSSSWQT